MVTIPPGALPSRQYLKDINRGFLYMGIEDGGGFEWFVTYGEPIPRNQSDSHPWFSSSIKSMPSFYQLNEHSRDRGTKGG